MQTLERRYTVRTWEKTYLNNMTKIRAMFIKKEDDLLSLMNLHPISLNFMKFKKKLSLFHEYGENALRIRS
jgi:hypothetical protein